MDRIEKLRLDALDHKLSLTEFFNRFYEYFDEHRDTERNERYGEALCYAFSNITPVISDGEIIVGRTYPDPDGIEQKAYDEKYNEIHLAELQGYTKGQDSHMAIDYELLLTKGVRGIIADIDGYLASSDESKRKFYRTCRRCLEAVIILSERYADYAAELAEKCSDSARKDELLKICEVCRNVPANPPKSFHEAVQSVSFITYCISLNPLRQWCQQFQLGHPDRYLYPFYEKDIKEGKITKEQAQLLLDLLGIQINFRVHSGLSSGYMVGGRDRNGNVVQNELTEMCMQVIDDIRLVYPSVGLCYTAEMDDKYLNTACEILSHGRSHPAIFGDDTITEGLRLWGVTEEDSHDYIHSTCVEITPVAASNVWVATPYTNMPQILLDCMETDYKGFDELLSAYYGILDERIRVNFEEALSIRKAHHEKSMIPLLSCFVNDCLKNGTDMEQGGARYNWVMPSFVGMGNLVDSLFAINELVFKKKELTVGEYLAIAKNNFEGNEALRLRILNTIPKYGNDMDEVDELYKKITEHIVAQCRKYKGLHQHGDLIPSVFCWIKHERFGRETGATPDGRVAGFPLGDGSGPCQGREMNGPTASIMSSTKWSHKEFIGGVAVNMKFSKASLGRDSIATMASLIKTYIARGGFEMQINVIDKETLEKAVLSPEEYRDLVVRVGGYSDYFTRLSPEMQQEVILRTAHEI